jgi:hypothetical protein
MTRESRFREILDPFYNDNQSLQPPAAYSSPEYFGSWLHHARPECRFGQRSHLANPDPAAQFWRERDLVARATQSEVPVFGSQGFLDFNVPPDQLPVHYASLRNGHALWLGQFIHDTPVDSAARIGKGAADHADRFLQEALFGKSLLAKDPRVVVQEAPALRWRGELQWPPADARQFAVPAEARGLHRHLGQRDGGQHRSAIRDRPASR